MVLHWPRYLLFTRNRIAEINNCFVIRIRHFRCWSSIIVRGSQNCYRMRFEFLSNFIATHRFCQWSHRLVVLHTILNAFRCDRYRRFSIRFVEAIGRTSFQNQINFLFIFFVVIDVSGTFTRCAHHLNELRFRHRRRPFFRWHLFNRSILFDTTQFTTQSARTVFRTIHSEHLALVWFRWRKIVWNFLFNPPDSRPQFEHKITLLR